MTNVQGNKGKAGYGITSLDMIDMGVNWGGGFYFVILDDFRTEDSAIFATVQPAP